MQRGAQSADTRGCKQAPAARPTVVDCTKATRYQLQDTMRNGHRCLNIALLGLLEDWPSPMHCATDYH